MENIIIKGKLTHLLTEKQKERYYGINGIENERWNRFKNTHRSKGCVNTHLELTHTGIGTVVKAVCNECRRKKLKSYRNIAFEEDITDYTVW